MDVGPVHDRADEGELLGEKGDVAQSAEIALGAAGLEAQAHPHVFDLGRDPSQTGLDHLDELFGRPFLGGSEMGADDPAPEGPAQLHGVLEGSKALLGAVLVLDCEDGEVGGMDRNPDPPFGREFTELATPGLLPREGGDKRQLVRAVTFRDQGVEECCIFLRLSWRQAGDAKPDERGLHVPEATQALFELVPSRGAAMTRTSQSPRPMRR